MRISDGSSDVCSSDLLDAALHEQRAETGAVGRHDRAIAAAFGPGQEEPAIAAALGLLRPVHLDPAVRTGERAMIRGLVREFVEKERNRATRIFGKHHNDGKTSRRARACQYGWRKW